MGRRRTKPVPPPPFTPDRAREAARRRWAARRTQSAQSTAQQPPLPADRYNPETVRERAQADALLEALRTVQPSARLRIQRLAPAWCRGWLEDVDPAAVRSAGGIHRYLGDTWGGSRYLVELLDAAGAPAGASATYEIVGPPRSWGVEIEQPRAAHFVMPPAYPLPGAPATAPINGLGELANAIARLAEAQARLEERLAHLALRSNRSEDAEREVTKSGLVSPPVGAVGDRLRGAVAEVADTVRALGEVRCALEQLAPGASEEPESGKLSPFARRAIERLLDRAIDRAASKGNGSSATVAANPESTADEQILDAERCDA